ncbi:MAG: VTT domain-containing protein [Deltaproteobacteria bacterium]|nr:VTT domain-containing protein [Deltaproteobacteria bacterium]
MGDPVTVAAEIQAVMQGFGPWAPLLLGGASLVEYVLPPFPGDTVTLVGGVMAMSGGVSWGAVVVALFLGNVVGMLVDWEVGRWLALHAGQLPGEAERPWWQPLSQERFSRFEVAYRKWGAWLLVGNRFLPAARAFFFLAAGAAGIPRRQTLFWGLISATLWNLGVLAAGAYLGGNLEEIMAFAARVGTGGWVVLGAALAAWALLLLARRLRQRRA